MTAYFVAVRKSVSDPAALKTYGERVGPASVGHDLKALAAYGKIRVVEGSPSEGAVILKFATFEAAEAWYDSGAYQEVVQYRLKGAEYHSFIVQGLDETPA